MLVGNPVQHKGQEIDVSGIATTEDLHRSSCASAPRISNRTMAIEGNVLVTCVPIATASRRFFRRAQFSLNCNSYLSLIVFLQDAISFCGKFSKAPRDSF